MRWEISQPRAFRMASLTFFSYFTDRQRLQDGNSLAWGYLVQLTAACLASSSSPGRTLSTWLGIAKDMTQGRIGSRQRKTWGSNDEYLHVCSSGDSYPHSPRLHHHHHHHCYHHHHHYHHRHYHHITTITIITIVTVNTTTTIIIFIASNEMGSDFQPFLTNLGQNIGTSWVEY